MKGFTKGKEVDSVSRPVSTRLPAWRLGRGPTLLKLGRGLPSGGDSKQTASSSSLDWRICGGGGGGLLRGVPGELDTGVGDEGAQAVRSLTSGVRGKGNRELGDRARLAWMEKER